MSLLKRTARPTGAPPRNRRRQSPPRRFESLECREMLAGDLAAAGEISAAVGAAPAEAGDTPSVIVAPALLANREGGLISDAQKENIRKLGNDLRDIASDSEVTREQVQQLVTDVVAIADGATRPDEELVDTLRENFSEAIADGELTGPEIVRLTADFAAVLESANIPQEEVEAVIQTVGVIVEASNVDREDVELIVSDLVAIVEEFQNRDPLISDTQKENLRSLASDLREIADRTTVTPEQAEAIRSEFRSIVEGATRPDRELVRELRRDVRLARSDGEVTNDERQQVAQSVDAVLESANITQEARDALWAEIAETGLTQDDVQTVAEDLAAIRQESRANRPAVAAGRWRR